MCHLGLCICAYISTVVRGLLRPIIVMAVKEFWALLDALFTPSNYFVLSVSKLWSYTKARLYRKGNQDALQGCPGSHAHLDVLSQAIRITDGLRSVY